MNKKQIMYDILDATNSGAILLYSPENRLWFSRFSSSLGYIVITREKTYLLLDGRYITAARTFNNLQNIDEIILLKGAFSSINEIIDSNDISKIIFESDFTFYNDFENYKRKLDCEVMGYNFTKVRMIKDPYEIEMIQKACDITNEVFLDVLEYVKPGMTEKEVSRFVSDCFLKHGADKLSFDTIVASGTNGAMPHAVPTDRVLLEGDFITLDMGCFYNGYCSDQTRTFALVNDNNSKLKEIYEIVLKAQSLGIEAVKPGVEAGEIHKICMDYIVSKGYGEYFTHGTGHGIGVQIHEEPYQANNQKTILQPGMCITVEPGIYIPEVGGVRIEDDILVKVNGYDFLTTSERKLVVVE